MASFSGFFLFFFLLISSTLFFASSSVSVKSLHEDEKSFQIFEVSASIHKARQFLAQTEETLQAEGAKLEPVATAAAAAGNHSSGLLSFSLHPRASIRKPHHKDYSGITLARLARDTSRVNSIHSKLQFKLSKYTQSDLKPVPADIRPEDFESPLTSGTSQGSGEYFARIGVGRPAKQFYMVIDTGSDVSWLQCQPCTDCYQQTDPIYNPTQSSTYQTVSCSSQECNALEVSACSGGTCLYQVSYGDGSYTVGQLVKETVSFGNSRSIGNVPIGCGHDNEGLFVGAAGIIGLARAPLSLPAQIKATSFSYCLVNRDSNSASTLEFNSAAPGDSVFASMVRNPRVDLFYYVDLVGMSVGGQKLPIPQSVFQVDGTGHGGIIVDSGTAVTRLQTQAYNALRDAFKRLAPNLPSSGGFALFDTCYDFSSMTSVKVPTVSFLFASGKALSLKPENYLIPVDSMGKYCLAFAPTSGSLSIIGNVQQQGTRVNFDLAKRLIGFSSNKC
ncbi:OLC1v1014256C1 [Oldenlandia corymbosa var. corymbosa]|uniref:OLC1v1014256C1 n=1 Tax=Oldenlandia corymbosa var. corymbosa TaxID=529605 RepID=A0AAV1E0M2_OLDCO|nr:OLC1v1014256C1 [Oldenlandia corymbosa var. corymbosa]